MHTIDRSLLLSALLLACTLSVLLATAGNVDARIYRWVDENGSVHFSDTPRSPEAEVVELRPTGISAEGFPEQKSESEPVARPEPTKAKQGKAPQKINPYRATASVGKLGADAISIRGRIEGPSCDDLLVTATARNGNDLSATISDRVSKSNSFGSTIFEGTDSVSGSADDYGFWKIDTIKVECLDADKR
jgi:hypothetical protein